MLFVELPEGASIVRFVDAMATLATGTTPENAAGTSSESCGGDELPSCGRNCLPLAYSRRRLPL